MKYGFIISICLLISSCGGISPALVDHRPTNWCQPIIDPNFTNLYKIDDHLYRSEQPTLLGIQTLEKMGTRTILSVRNLKSDRSINSAGNLTFVHYRINTWTISYKEVVDVLKEIANAPKPLLIHCKHGSDRTGCIVAAYRMAYMNWDKEEAIREFTSGGYGYHEEAFPNILRLLNEIDVKQLREDISRPNQK